MNKQENILVIPAGGSGSRLRQFLSGESKQFAKIQDKTVLEITLQKFYDFIQLKEAILAICDENFESNKNFFLSKFPTLKIVRGGKERQDSVYNALEVVESTSGKVIIHDAVRPFFSKENLERVIETCDEKSGAILAVRAKDTIRKVKNNLSDGVLDRESIYLVQTPQVFDLNILTKVYEMAKRDGFYGTDDAMLFEKYGYKIKIVDGDYKNFKITTPFDFEVANFFISKELEGKK